MKKPILNKVPRLVLKLIPTNIDTIKITNLTDAYRLGRKLFDDDKYNLQEEIIVILLNTSNYVTGYFSHSVGSANSTVCDLPLMLGYALKHRAKAMIVCHNHPSGNPKPSNEDKKLCQTINKACEFLHLKLIDFIIFGDTKIFSIGYYSFSCEGLL